MGINYGKLKETAQRLVSDNGKTVSLITAQNVLDPVTGQNAKPETETLVKAVVMPYSQGLKLVPDSMVLTDAKMVTIADTISATVGDIISIDDVRYSIVYLATTNPNDGDPVKYDMVVSK